MLRRCPDCGITYYPESGYYVGAMIINYGVTAALVLTTYLFSRLFPDFTRLSLDAKLLLWMAFAIAVSLLLMRHAYSFWLGLDFWLNPWQPGEGRLK